ncbi:hypothetical protein FQN49_002136 [Arthroderma sp. PD_2]|nr:hypothetical protein FQN49_002136 [Arthroderma sp. PD_2]
MAPPTMTETAPPATAPTTLRTEVEEYVVKGETPEIAQTRALFPKPPVFEDKAKEREHLKGRLALAFRIFAKFGYDEGVAGHITLRDPVDPTTFWVNPFGVPFAHIRSSDLIQVNHEGVVIAGGEVRRLNTAAYMIHAAVHEARPEVQCAAHSHSIYGRTFSTLGIELDITTQDSCAFYKDHALYGQFKGIVLGKEEGINIAKAVGNKKAAILQNHGLLTVGRTIEETVFWFYALEKCCYSQLLADAAAKGRGCETVKIPDDDAQYTFNTIGTPFAGYFNGLQLFEVAERETKGEHLQ